MVEISNLVNMSTMICMPDYNEKIDPIYSVVFMNIITLGGSSLISLFGLDDIILCLLFWFQIIAANNNQGFLNRIYSYTWRIIDIIGAFIITTYMFFKYGNIIPKIIAYPYYIILSIAAYSQSRCKSLKDYISFVNIWHLLVLYYLIMTLYFKYPNSFLKNEHDILIKIS